MRSCASLSKQGGRRYGQSRDAFSQAATVGRIGTTSTGPSPVAPTNQPFNVLATTGLIGIAHVRRHEYEDAL